MAEEKLTMFGKTYNTVGSAKENLILQTKGDLKIRWGNKFIDLVKNGKINAECEVIKSIESSDKITKDGIYYVATGEKEEIWVSCDGNKVNITGNSDNEYISYTNQQTLTPDQQLIALHNIGFIFDTLDSANAANLTSGIVYVIADSTLYTANGGVLSPYMSGSTTSSGGLSIPDPLKIGNVTIYGSESRIIGDTILTIGIESRQMLIGSETIEVHNNLTTESGSYIMSDDFITDQKGYRLYYVQDNGYTELEIDNVKVRKELTYNDLIDIKYQQFRQLILSRKLKVGHRYKIVDFQNEWELTSNPVLYGADANVHPIIVTVTSNNTISAIAKFEENLDWDVYYDPLFYGSVFGTMTRGRVTKLIDRNNNQANYDFKHRKFEYNNTQYYTFNYIDNNENKDASNNNLIHDNIINIAEPTITTVDQTEVVTLPTSWIIFKESLTQQIQNNTIKQVTGQLFIECIFNNNNIDLVVGNQSVIPSGTFTKDYINTLQSSTFTQDFRLVGNTFSGILTAQISGNIYNSQFKDLTGNIQISGISDVTIWENIAPDSVQYVESVADPSNQVNGWTFTQIANLAITTQVVPKLAKQGQKDCYIKRGTKTIFAVRQQVDDSTFSGMIMMFNGSVADIPEGWVICDGTNGTPDLTDRFIKAATSDNDVGESNNTDLDQDETTGEYTNYLTIKNYNLPQHNHYFKLSGSISPNDLTVTVDSASTYVNDFYYDTTRVESASEGSTWVVDTITKDYNYFYTNVWERESHDHTASIEGSISLTGVSVEQDSETESSEYENQAINIEPQAYALLFIMKL